MNKTKRQPKYLTPKDFCQLKLSEAIPYVIDDMKRMVKMGIKIDMDSWERSGYKKGFDVPQVCSVCAGVAACLGFYSKEEIQKYDGDLVYARIAGTRQWSAYMDKIRITFNGLRYGNLASAAFRWRRPQAEIYDKLQLVTVERRFKSFEGRMEPSEQRRLYAQLRSMAKELEKLGL